MTGVSVYGVGTSDYGKQPHLSAPDLAHRAVLEAIGDAGTDDVDAVFVGTVFGASGIAQRALETAGVLGVPIVTVENACASGTTAFHEGVAAVQAGRYERVLALGIEQMSTLFSGPIVPEATDAEGASGFAMPAMYAMSAARYAQDHGLTPEQLASVAVKNYRNAAGNPRAQRKGVFTRDQILTSRPIADPLTVLQCSPISDGAAAAIIGPSRIGDVRVLGTSLRAGAAWGAGSEHVWGFDLIRGVAQEVYEATGLGPQDVDLFEVHDAFTIGEIVTIEALGLTGLGRGGAFTASGATAIDGALPVNPSGGLLGRGHPLGATGLAQIAEVVNQLRGRAEGRQVVGARRGLVETMGGGAAGTDGNACVVVMLAS